MMMTLTPNEPRLLLVAAEGASRRRLAKELFAAGYLNLTCAVPRSALGHLRARAFDMVILDVGCRDEDPELRHQLRTEHACNGTSIVSIGNRAARCEAITASDDCLQGIVAACKPGDLVKRVAALVAGARARRVLEERNQSFRDHIAGLIERAAIHHRQTAGER